MGKARHNILALFSLALLLSACNNINLAPMGPQMIESQSIGSFCTYDPKKITTYTNYLFVIDYSGSNSWTDPQNNRVTNTINFIEAHRNDPYTQFGAIMFDDNSWAAIYQTSNKNPILTSDPNLINQGEARLRAGGGGGSTNYSGAIQMAQQAIQNDIQLNPDRVSNYEVIFLTDGMPNEGITSQSGLVGVVQTLVNVDPGHVFFSDAYYGEQGDASLLQAMAKAGNGVFQDITNNPNGLDINSLIVGPSLEPWQMKNFLVYNLNSAICEDGSYDVDSNGSGVCDKDKIKYGLNPQKRSTAGDGYSDYFHYLVATGRMIKDQLVPCDVSKQTDGDMDLLNDCEEALLQNKQPNGTKLMTADPKNPDTDVDGLIDGLEPLIFRNTMGSAMNNQDVLIDWNGMGVSAWTQIFNHINPLVPNQTQPRYNIDVKFTNYTPDGQSCYSVSIKNMQLYNTLPTQDEGTLPYLKGHRANENRILIYYFQTPYDNPSGEELYMYSFQTLKADPNYDNALGPAAGLEIDDSVFTPYIIPVQNK